MANSLPRSIVLTMVVAFCASFAVMYWRHHSLEEMPSTPDAAAGIRANAGPPEPSRIPAQESPEPASPAGRPATDISAGVLPATAHSPDAADHAEETPAEALPVVFHIRNRRDVNQIDGDIRNTTSKPMSIALRAVSASTQAMSEIHFELAPGERRTFNSDSGLYLQANDELTLHSPPYLDRVVQVP